jgi:hypothetical protein
VNLDDDDGECTFVTQSTIAQLGRFVIKLMKEKDEASKKTA